jgi:4,4'-diaponeurosporenoate glycosyltransferase
VRATVAGRLVFLDADVRLRPEALATIVAHHDRTRGLLSVAPYHRMRGLVERLSTTCNVVSFMGVGASRPTRRRKPDGAFGPCMITTRDDYEAVGGHAAVRHSVIEDLALSKSYVAHGLRNDVVVGSGLVEYRMYPGGINELVEGWSKNLAGGARFVPATTTLLVALWITGLLVAVQTTVLTLIAATPTRLVGLAGIYAAFALQQWLFARRLTNAGLGWALLFPITVVVFVAIFVRSLWLTLVRRRVRWRGRAIDLVGHGDRATELQET